MKHRILFIVCLLMGANLCSQTLREVQQKKTKSQNPLFHKLGKAYKAPAFECEDWWVWGSSVIKGEDGKYHMFVSRFPKSLPFHPGWMVASEIVHATSDVPQGPYKLSDIALTERGAQYWDGRSAHNPRILKAGDAYYLIYMGSTHPFDTPTARQLTLESPWCIVARSNKRIGIAKSQSLYGPWTRIDEPILKTKPNTFYSFLTSNPSPIVETDGSVTMIFKGREYIGNDKYSDMALGIAKAKHIEGPYEVQNNNQPIFQVNGQGEAEDPFLWKDPNGYHIIFKDHVGKYTIESKAGAMAHSKDAIHWTIDKDAQSYSKTLEWEDGTVTTQGQLERPFILFENDKPAYIFFATMDGPGGFDNATRSWNIVIPILE